MGPLAYGEVDQQQKRREDTLQETNGLEFCLILSPQGLNRSTCYTVCPEGHQHLLPRHLRDWQEASPTD